MAETPGSLKSKKKITFSCVLLFVGCDYQNGAQNDSLPSDAKMSKKP
jgi:hypothetical protein